MRKVISLFIVLVLLGCASAPKTQEEAFRELTYKVFRSNYYSPLMKCLMDSRCMASMPINEFQLKRKRLLDYEVPPDKYEYEYRSPKLPELMERYKERRARFYALLDTFYCKARRGKIMSKAYMSCLPADELSEFNPEEDGVCVVDGRVIFLSRGRDNFYSEVDLINSYNSSYGNMIESANLKSRPVFSSAFKIEKVVSPEGTEYRVNMKVTKLSDSYLVTSISYSPKGEVSERSTYRVKLCKPFWRADGAGYDRSILFHKDGARFVFMDNLSQFFGLSLSEAVVMQRISIMTENQEREFSSMFGLTVNDMGLKAEDFVSSWLEGKLNWPNVLAGKTISLKNDDIHIEGTLTPEQMEILRTVSDSFPEHEVKGSGPWHMKAVVNIHPASGRIIIKSLSLE